MKSWMDLTAPILTNYFGTALISDYRGSTGLKYFPVRYKNYIEQAKIPEIQYEPTGVNVTYKTVQAFTFYCDSLSGCDENHPKFKDGDGSKEYPWRSFFYAFKMMQEIVDCYYNEFKGICDCDKDRYFQLKVRGSIDYVYKRDWGYSFPSGPDPSLSKQKLIVSPWEQEWIQFKELKEELEYGTNDKYYQPYYNIGGNTIYNNIKLNNNGLILSNDIIINNFEIILGRQKTPNPHYYINSIFSSYYYDYVIINMNVNHDNYSTLEEGYIYWEIGLIGVFINSNISASYVYISDCEMYGCSVNMSNNIQIPYKELFFYRNGYFQLYNCSFSVSGSLFCEAYEVTYYDHPQDNHTESLGRVFGGFWDNFFYEDYYDYDENIWKRKCYYDTTPFPPDKGFVVYNTSLGENICLACADQGERCGCNIQSKVRE